MNKVITEITNLGEKDCFYLVERYKDEFSYPLHKHEELELNFVAHCKGARRIVGDSMEVLGSMTCAWWEAGWSTSGNSMSAAVPRFTRSPSSSA